MIAQNTKQILKENEVMAKKFYGQNFLVNEDILKRICEVASLSKDDYVLEIGVGLGALTEYLASNAKKVLCYEIDEEMYEISQKNLKSFDNIEFILADFLKRNVKEDIESCFGKGAKVKVVANLPYYVTTKIMIKLFELDCIREEVFMVQKEMGERFTGEVSTKDYNALSVYVKYFSDAKIAFSVSKGNFYPAPEVDSVVLFLKPNKKELGIDNESKFLKFVKASFAHRRKTFVNNISSAYRFPKADLEGKLESLGLNKNIRSEEIDLEGFAIIYKKLFEEKKDES